MRKAIIISAIVAALTIAGDAHARSSLVNGIRWTYSVSGGKACIEGIPESTEGAMTIPEKLGGYSVTSIGDWAFAYCDSLTSVTIPNSVTSIGGSAFAYCDNLTSVMIPNSVTTIGNSAFTECSGLTSMAIPDSVTSIGESAFENCSRLISFSVGENNQVYSSADGLLLSKDGKTVIIGVNGDVTIPNSVTTIGDGAFGYCESLMSVTIPDSVTTIGDGAFGYCHSLASIAVDAANTVFDSRNNCNAVICTADDTLVAGCKNTEIPNSVTSVGDGAFSGCRNLTSVTIPDSVTSIGDWAFEDCDSLVTVVIPDSVTSIGDYAFSGCDGLTSVVIPDSVETMGEWVFSGCDSLEILYLPQWVVPYLDDLDIPDTCSVANSDVYSFVRRLYNLCLNREPDWAGCAHWAKGLTSGEKNGAMTAYGFCLSAEMKRRNLSNADYVEILYRAMMDRAPDAAGKAHWVELLDNGISRAGVFQGFAESAEFTRICNAYGITRGNVDRSRLEPRDVNRGVTQFVVRCYTKALNRNYDVDGLNHWCEKINSSSAKKATAIQVSKNFLTSAEFQRRRLSNSAFVDVLYQTFLDRAADAAGKQHWVAKLNSGVSRNTVMAGFYNSKEFAAIMAKYGIR